MVANVPNLPNFVARRRLKHWCSSCVVAEPEEFKLCVCVCRSFSLL